MEMAVSLTRCIGCGRLYPSYYVPKDICADCTEPATPIQSIRTTHSRFSDEELEDTWQKQQYAIYGSKWSEM